MVWQFIAEAVWFDVRKQYVADVERYGGCWYSGDGDNWTYEDGCPVQSEAFAHASIRLMGGPRNREVVS